jgi:hemerythrin-like metal-binding protein
MKLGFAPIDDDHEKVLTLVAEVEGLIAEQASTQTLQQSFARLVEMTVDHFRSEERGMEACGYPDLTVHKREHEEITDWLFHLRQSLREETSESVSHVTRSETIAFFRAWVEQHLLQFDAPAVRFIVGVLEGVSPTLQVVSVPRTVDSA